VVLSGAPFAVLFNSSKDWTTKSTFLSNAHRIPKEQHVDSGDGKEENQPDATVTVYSKIQISSTCFGQQFFPSSGALDCAIELVV
jgi:hypothetical protein